MNEEIRNTKFWSYILGFVKKDVVLPDMEITVVGYFPYHTARIRQRLHKTYTVIPRSFLKSFEEALIKHNIMDNKAVYICEANPNCLGSIYHWAIMLKDDYAIIGSWEEVVTYEGKCLKINKKLGNESIK